MKRELEVAFENAMREGSFLYQKKTGIRPTRYLHMIDSYGGIGAATELTLKSSRSPGRADKRST